MVEIDDFKVYLPRYLSDESLNVMFEDIKKFVQNGSNDEVYTSRLKNEKMIFQGDAIQEMPAVTLPETELYNCKAIVLSNSCDINLSNTRPFTSYILYSPIVRLSSYRELLESNGMKPDKLKEHIDKIKSQTITQVLYLPQHKYGPDEDCLVFLDKICHCDNSTVDRESLNERRLFSFNNFGFYLLLLKISIHFTRIREAVDRDKGEVLS